MEKTFSANVAITSGHVTKSIEASVVNLAKIVQIENRCNIEDAIETTRDFLIRKHNELIDKNNKEAITKLVESIKVAIKNKKATENDKLTYRLMEYLRLL